MCTSVQNYTYSIFYHCFVRHESKYVPRLIGNWIIATYTFSLFSVMLFLMKIHSSDVKQVHSHIALVIKVKVKPEIYVTHEQMISFETSDRSCQWKNSHVNHETESAVLWKSWSWRLFCSYVDVLHSSFNNNVKISCFFFNLRFCHTDSITKGITSLFIESQPDF